MGHLRLNRILHARFGIPWVAVGIAAVPAVAMIASAFIWHGSGRSWSLLRWGMLFWAVTAAFFLDEPAQSVVGATPRNPTWWHVTRLLGAATLLALPTLAAVLWSGYRIASGIPGLSVQMVSAWLVVLAGAAVARRLGHDTPGELVTSVTVLFLLYLHISPVPARIVGTPLLTSPLDSRWDDSIRLWILFGVFALIALVIAVWWRPKPRQAADLDSATGRIEEGVSRR